MHTEISRTTPRHGATPNVTRSAVDDLQSAIWVIIWVVLTKLAMKDDLNAFQEMWYNGLGTEQNSATVLTGKIFVQNDAKESTIFPQYDTLDKFVKHFLQGTHRAKPESHDQLFQQFYSYAQQIVSGDETDMDAW